MQKITIDNKIYDITSDAYNEIMQFKRFNSEDDFNRICYMVELDISAIANLIELYQVEDAIKIFEEEKIVKPTKIEMFGKKIESLGNNIDKKLEKLFVSKWYLFPMILIACIWGGFQSTMFPMEIFGILFILTSFIGG